MSERAATLTEYAVLLGLISMIGIGAVFFAASFAEDMNRALLANTPFAQELQEGSDQFGSNSLSDSKSTGPVANFTRGLVGVFVASFGLAYLWKLISQSRW